MPWPAWVVKAWSSPSAAKWPRTAASTVAAGRAGLQDGLAGLECTDARLEEVALTGRRRSTDGERVGEVAAVARDDHRKVEEHQVAPLDRPRRRRAPLLAPQRGPDAKSP